MPTLGEAVSALEERLFVGREQELAIFRRWLAAETAVPEILNVFGPGGVGKSTLVRAFQRIALSHGRPAVLVDSHNFRATPEGLLAAVHAALSQAQAFQEKQVGNDVPVAGLKAIPSALTDGGRDDVPRLAELVGSLNALSPLLVIDTFEELGGLTGYLRDKVLPLLDAHVKLVIAGRHPLAQVWSADDVWRKLIRPMPLGGFSVEESNAYLERRGLADRMISERIVQVGGGYPLALSLATDLALQFGVRDFSATPEWRLMVRSLTERLLRDVREPDLRELLEAASVVRQFDEAMLAAVSGRAEIADGFERLCQLSVVRPAKHGLMLHDDVRRILAEDLRWRRRERYSELRLRALARYRELAQCAPPDQREWLIAERLFLWEHGLAQALFFVEDEDGEVWVEPGRPEDLVAVQRIWLYFISQVAVPQMGSADFSRFDPEIDVADLARLVALPGTRFRVARDRTGTVVGFSIVLPLFQGSKGVVEDNPSLLPLAEACLSPEEWKALPLRSEAASVFYLLHVAYGDVRPEPVRAALLRDYFGVFALGGVYLCTTPLPEYKALLEALGFELVPEVRVWFWGQECPPIDGYRLDLRRIGVETWIEAILSGRRPPRPIRAEELERELQSSLLRWRDSTWLAQSPLAALLPRAGGPGASPTSETESAELVRTAVREALRRARAQASPDDELAYRALELGYLEKAVSHERVAERLAVSRTTFYRLLKRGVQGLARALAQPEA